MPQARAVPKSSVSSDREVVRKSAPVRLADGPAAFAAVTSPSIALQQMVADSLSGANIASQRNGVLTPLQKLAIWIGLTSGLWAIIGLAVYALIGIVQVA